jgi:hypothetical protein
MLCWYKNGNDIVLKDLEWCAFRLQSLLEACGRLIVSHFSWQVYFTEFQLFPGQDEKYWPLMPALPSYGYGRERKGPRFGSLIHGQNLRDVVITGLLFL